jgi:hypothetical protein
MKTNAVLIAFWLIFCMAITSVHTMHEACAEGIVEVCEADETTIRETSFPTIGFIESPDAYCYKPDLRRDECYITWGDIFVDAAPAGYMIDLNIIIDGRLVARNHGFFQNTMNIPTGMHGNGFKVKCGKPVDHDDDPETPELGNRYEYSIRARDSSGVKASNFGSVYCPPHVKGKK